MRPTTNTTPPNPPAVLVPLPAPLLLKPAPLLPVEPEPFVPFALPLLLGEAARAVPVPELLGLAAPLAPAAVEPELEPEPDPVAPEPDEPDMTTGESCTGLLSLAHCSDRPAASARPSAWDTW